MDLGRIVETTPRRSGFRFEHFKQYDFLRDKEVVLTFDDGPRATRPPCSKHWPTSGADNLLRGSKEQKVHSAFRPLAPGAASVAALLREFGQRSALRGGNPFRAKAYARAADNLLTLRFRSSAEQERLLRVPPVFQ